MPLYKHAPWFELLKELAIDEPIAIPRSDDIFLRRGQDKVGNTPWNVTLLVRVSRKANRNTPVIDWDFPVQQALAESTRKVRQINSLTKALITATTTGVDDDVKTATINAVTRSQTTV